MQEKPSKKQATIFDDILDQLIENPRQGIAVILLGLSGMGVWKKDWLLSLLPYSPETIQHWLTICIHIIQILVALLLLFLLIRWICAIFRIQRQFDYVQLLPHTDDGVSKEMLSQLMRRIHGTKRRWIERLFLGRERFSFVIHYTIDDEAGVQYRFYIGAEKNQLEAIKSNFHSVYPNLTFFPADNLEFPSKKAVGGRLKLKSNNLKKSLPLSRYKSDQLPGIISHMKADTWLQVGFTPNDGWKLRKAIQKLEEDLKGDKPFKDYSAFDKEELASLKHRYSGNEVAFDCTVSIASEYYPGVPVVKSIANAIHSVLNNVNELKYKKWKKAVQWYPTGTPYNMTWTGSELANLLHLPHFDERNLMQKLAKEIPHSKRGEELLPDHVLSNEEGSVDFGVQHHQFVKNRTVRILMSVLQKHWSLLGVTGSGKSTLLNNVLMSYVQSFIKHGNEGKTSPGFSFVDPARNTAMILLNQMLKAEHDGAEINWNKVHWISFKDTDYPPALNLLHRFPNESPERVTQIIMRIISENFQVAKQTERLLVNCIKTLVLDTEERHTILGVKPLINDFTFRQRILNRLEDDPEAYDVIDFWNNEAEDLIDASRIALFNRLDTFTSNPLLRRMFGQKEFTLPILQWMDEGHIIFYDFSGLSEEEAGLIGGFLTYLYYRVADTRGGTPLMHQFVFDEAARLEKMTILPRIIAEQRQKGLSLGIGTQSMHQLDQELKNALKEVQGNFFVCRQGPEGAAAASKMFSVPGSKKDQPLFSESYFTSLPDLVTVIRTQDQINGSNEIVQCVVKLPPLDRYMPNGQKATFKNVVEEAKANAWTAQKVKELASKNGYHKSEVDLMIRAYLQGEEYVPKKQPTKEKKKPRAPLQAQPETPIFLQKKQRIDTENVASEKVVEAGSDVTKEIEVEVKTEPIQPAITLSRKKRVEDKAPVKLEKPTQKQPFKPMLKLSWEKPVKAEKQAMKEMAASIEPVSDVKEQIQEIEPKSIEPAVTLSKGKTENLPKEPQPIVSLRKKKPSEKNE
ncbi:AAA-like domain-containing protein [Priestia aryabhattai B8W22]|uniref:TraM recognition domain-containing protein n=1 Tax=Priestia aryabhattai TaxID=412384 RepID=UPI000883AA93|nr:AAA-like domain-containing protein [Priestia aryabhattai B8W22]